MLIPNYQTAISPGDIYHVERYQADDTIKPVSSMLTLGSGIVAGVAAGLLAAVVSDAGFHIIWLTPLCMAVAIGFAMTFMVRVSKNTNAWITAAAAILAALAGVTSMHLGEYSYYQAALAEVDPDERQFALTVKAFEGREHELPILFQEYLADPDYDHEYYEQLQVETFPEYMEMTASQGIEIGSVKKRRGSINLGYQGTIIYWLLEALAIAVIATGMVWRSATNPFCSGCDQWCETTEIGTLSRDAKQVADQIERGMVVSLLQGTQAESETQLQLFRCGSCESPDTSVLRVNQISWHNGHRNDKNRGTFVISDAMVVELLLMFADDSESTEGLRELQQLQREAAGIAHGQADLSSRDEEANAYFAGLMDRQKAGSES